MRLGYCRVSARDQNPERQINKMRTLGIDERYIFVDAKSGVDFNRPQYQAMRLIIREGDLLYLDALDRLGRDYDEIIREWRHITRELNADIVVLENETLFDSRKFKVIIEPLEVSVYPKRAGRPKILTDAHIIQIMFWKSENLSNCEIAKRLHVSESTIRKYLKNY